MDLEQCLRLLRANSDEEKFVGLYLITKFIKAEPGPTLPLIWEAIGSSFLQRMLKTEGKVGAAEGFSYRGLALSILAAFSVDAALATDPQFIATVPSVVVLVHPRSHSEPDVVRDALQCLIAVTNSSDGTRKVVDSDGLSAVLLGVAQDQPAELLKARLHLCDKLVPFMRASQIGLPAPSSAAVLAHLASLFRHNQGALKFVILERLPAVLALCFESQHQKHSNERTAEQQNEGTWIEDIRVGLFYVLVSKIGRLQKEHALTLCAHMLRYFGEAWAVGPVPPLSADNTSGTAGGEQNVARFVEVMMMQTGVETRLLLDSYMHPEIMIAPKDESQAQTKAKSHPAPGLGTWEQEGKRKGGPPTASLPPEAMIYAPSLPLPASSASATYAIEELDEDEENENESGSTSTSSSTSSSSSSSTPAPRSDPLMELLSSPSDDLQERFESMISIYYEILEHAITFLAAGSAQGEMDEDSEEEKLVAKKEKKKTVDVGAWTSFDYKALENIKKVLSDVFETILDFVRDVQREKEEKKQKARGETKGKKGKEKSGIENEKETKADLQQKGGAVRLTLEDLEKMDLGANDGQDSQDKMDVGGEQQKKTEKKPDGRIEATDLVVVATMRLLGLWISHDTETLKDSLMRVLPFLVNLKTDSARVGVDPFSFLLPGLVPLTQEDDARDKFLDADGHIRLLAFTAEETAAQRANQSADRCENFGPLVSCLGILLNLVCLEEGLVNHRDPTTLVCYLPVLSDVMRLTDISAPPGDVHETEKALVMAHALVAACFILKYHTADSVMHHWSELRQELSKRGVRTVTETRDPALLQGLLVDAYLKLCALCQGVEPLWSEISELWFMATEALRVSLKTHPELGAKVKQSQWLPRAMATKDGPVQAALRSIVESIP